LYFIDNGWLVICRACDRSCYQEDCKQYRPGDFDSDYFEETVNLHVPMMPIWLAQVHCAHILLQFKETASDTKKGP
jgi:hypothetical protein